MRIAFKSARKIFKSSELHVLLRVFSAINSDGTLPPRGLEADISGTEREGERVMVKKLYGPAHEIQQKEIRYMLQEHFNR